MALVSPQGELLQTNDELREHAGDDARHFWDFAPAADREALRESWPPESDGPEQEQRYIRADGTLGWFIWRHSLIRDAAGHPDHYISQGVDITARKHDAERLDHQAHHDPLTGLPNRALFDRTLAEALERRTESNTRLAVLFVDIDDFKVINDSLGHRAGDELLVAAADRLLDAVRPGDTIARFGGDEFVILLERIMSLSDLRRVADRVAGEIKRPFELDGRQRFLSSSIGIAVADGGEGEVTAEELLRDADAAMYQAKEHGKAQMEFFDRGVRSRAVERLELEAELRDALAGGELSLAYQPEVMLSDTTRRFGFEALLRWQHPELGSVSPARFVPIAEQSGLIVPIGEWVLQEACRQAAAWRAQGQADFVMAVNLSPRQLSSPQLAGVVEAALRANDLPPSALCLEITESAIMEDPEAAHRILQGLKGARRQAGDRRLRRRLLLAVAPQVPAARRRDQDRQVLRRRAARVTRRPRDHHRDRPARPRARRHRRGRRRRERRAGRRAARPRLPRRAGLPLLQAAARRTTSTSASPTACRPRRPPCRRPCRRPRRPP